jgi:gamma-glutamylcyclotransferase (GGCT)/AIG2-like uncharacterized protein YtfP
MPSWISSDIYSLHLKQWLQIITVFGGAIVGGSTIYIYYRNSQLRRMEWLYQLYEKFFYLHEYNEIRRIIDYGRPEDLLRLRTAIAEIAPLNRANIKLEEELVDFLNFFQLIASLWKRRQLRFHEIEFMFKYYLCRIGDYPILMEYLKSEGFGTLNDLITKFRTREKIVPENLYVYGTLRSDSDNSMFRVLARYSELVGEATYQGQLFKVDYYPGAIPSDNPKNTVHGQVYRLHRPQRVLEILDRFEECGPQFPQPTEYVRKKQTVRLNNGDPIVAWVYVYNRPTAGLEPIESGDFVKAGTA